MNFPVWLLPASCIAIAIGAASLLLARTWSAQKRTGNRLHKLPFMLRLVRWPALMLVPAVSLLMSAAYQRRMLRTLDANGLYPQLAPAQWLASRTVLGIIAAALTLAVPGAASWLLAALAGGGGFLAGGIWLRRLNLERERLIARELPAYLDLLTVCVEAGATLTAGVRLIVEQAPDTPLRGYFERVLREVRSGRTRAEAFVHVAEIHNVENLTTLAGALAHAEGSGMSLGQILRTQSGQRTAERFARAERLAMQAPVKMLGPLIFCIFPCTFIVIAVPIVVRLLEVFRS